ncbi:RAS1 protein, partial [Balamuthia mandrillaris]
MILPLKIVSYRKQVEVDGVACMLVRSQFDSYVERDPNHSNNLFFIKDIMDTAGQEEYSALRDQYMKTGQGFILVYSITSPTSFEAATKLRTQILRIKEDHQDIPIVLVANKVDLEEERAVSAEEGKSLAQKFNTGFIEASAKSNHN